MTETPQSPGARMYEEFLAVHTVLRRGTELVVNAFDRLAEGDRTDVKTLVESARWLIDFTHWHHESEDALFWPVLLGFHPEVAADFDTLAKEHEALDQELNALTRVVDQLAVIAETGDPAAPTLRPTARDGAAAARQMRSTLTSHLDGEEPVVQDLFPSVPGTEIDRLRTAILAGGPRYGTHLLLGLLEDPEPGRGCALLAENFPPAFRQMGPQFLQQYQETKEALRLIPA